MTKAEQRQAEAEAEALQLGLGANNGSGGHATAAIAVAPKPEKGKGKGPQYGAAIAELREQNAQLSSMLAGFGDLLRSVVAGQNRQASQAVPAAPTAPIPAPAVPHPLPPQTIDVETEDGEVIPMVTYPQHVARQVNLAAQETVAQQVSAVRSRKLVAGVIPYRDNTVTTVSVVKKDAAGKPVLGADGKPEMEIKKLRTDKDSRRYVDETCRNEMRNITLRVEGPDGKPTNQTLTMTYKPSSATDAPQYELKATAFTVRNADGNMITFAGNPRGIYFWLTEYYGAPLSDYQAEQAARYAA